MSCNITAPTFEDFVERAASKYYPMQIDSTQNIHVMRMSPSEFHKVFKTHYERGFNQPYVNSFASPSIEFTRAKQNEFCRRHMERHVIKKGEELIGWVTGDLLDPETFYLRNGTIFPEYRKQGIMRAFLEHKISYLSEIGYELVTASHEWHNAPVIKLMLSLGFFICGTEFDDRFGLMVRTLYIVDNARRQRAYARLGPIIENLTTQANQLLVRPHDQVKIIKALDEKYHINGYRLASDGNWVCLIKVANDGS